MHGTPACASMLHSLSTSAPAGCRCRGLLLRRAEGMAWGCCSSDPLESPQRIHSLDTFDLAGTLELHEYIGAAMAEHAKIALELHEFRCKLLTHAGVQVWLVMSLTCASDTHPLYPLLQVACLMSTVRAIQPRRPAREQAEDAGARGAAGERPPVRESPRHGWLEIRKWVVFVATLLHDHCACNLQVEHAGVNM